MKRVAFIAVSLVMLLAIAWRFPLFHVLPLEASQGSDKQRAFDAAAFAEEFWTTQLLPHVADAPPAAEVLAALRENPAEARRLYGRTVGVSRSAYYLVRGEGTITTVDHRRIGVTLEPAPEGDQPSLWLVTGPIFGNAVRDASGLIDGGDFPNSQHFNALAAALNRLVEERVAPPLVADARPGAHIEFVGCLEATDKPLSQATKVIPLSATVK